MSEEQRLAHTPARHAPRPTEAHNYFVGRRGSEAAEVYAVTVTSVGRLRSKPGARESTLDWHGSAAARMELSDDRRRRLRVLLRGGHRPQLLERLVHQAPERGRVILIHPVGKCHVKDGHARLGGEDRRVR